MRRGRLGWAFYTAAALDGMMFGVLALSVPMHIEALHRPASLAGEVLATGTVTVAGGALVAGRVGRLVGGGRNLLAAALGVSGLGEILLFLASAAPAMAVGAALVGAGIGLFWVASQTLLGEASGEPGSERAFATHYAAYTFGVAGGSTGAGLVIALLRDAGVGAVAASRYSYILGILAAALAVTVWRPARRQRVAEGPHARLTNGLSTRGVAIQVPDLLLVAALALLLPLAPIVLAGRFHLAPILVGITVGGIQAAKIGGAFAGRIITRESGHRRAILLLLGAGAVLSLALCASTSTLGAPLFVLALVATSFVATGAWPLIVDSALARIEPDTRPSVTVTWNALEYGVIATVTALSGWLLASLHSPELLFALGAALLAAATVSAGFVLRLPVYAPEVPELSS